MKTIVITGASRGIGLALARLCVQQGSRVIGVARSYSLLEELSLELGELFVPVSADIIYAQDRAHIAAVVSSFAKSEIILVHNAGILEPMVLLRELELEAYRHLMAVNVEGPLFLTQALLPYLTGGRVLHVSSGASMLAIPGINPYCLSKALLQRISASFASEESEIAFTSCFPGLVDTAMFLSLSSEEFRGCDQYRTLVDKVLPAQIVARFLAWLLLGLDATTFAKQDWDIYDVSHHAYWSQGACIVDPFSG